MARRPRKKEKREFPLLHLLPNFLTVGAICAGLTAIRFAFQGDTQTAVWLILLAAILDGLDGRVARLLKSESAIGAELDSLADFLNFGVAPSLTLYLWALQETRSEGWIAVLIYTICCVMRLARFNVGIKHPPESEEKKFFTGIPAPAGAMLVMLPFFLSKLIADDVAIAPIFVGFYMIAIGLLMISRLPTPSLKSITIRAENARFVVLGFVALVAALMSYPWATLAFLDVAYLISLAWAWRACPRQPKVNKGA